MIRAVVDTNLLIRAVIMPQGSVGALFDALTAERFRYLFSEAALDELQDVLSRPRLRRKFPITDDDVQAVLEVLRFHGEQVEPAVVEPICRDPKDDKFLALAKEGSADVIVTTDQDLLVLHPFEGIPLLGAGEFLAKLDHDS